MDDIEGLGSQLRQVREARGISLEEVQAKTKIPIDILRSIEREEKIRRLSPVYLKGFLKIYAKFLGVKITTDEASKTGASFAPKKESNAFEKSKFQLSSGKKINYFLWIKIFVSLVILIVLIRFVIFLSHKRKLAPSKTSVPQVVSTVKLPEVRSQEKATRRKLAIRAKENTWLQVKCDGKLFFRGILRKGTSESWVAKDKFELSVGNAAAIDLELDNKVISPLGRRGQALKNITITKDGLSVEK
ncbi:MAG: DUF4115 domain-containing protein [Candidatus Omnitrophota bacterium]|nr:DUF4115 domain-containing protein [Candidatus Omnitrophota bacterium]